MQQPVSCDLGVSVVQFHPGALVLCPRGAEKYAVFAYESSWPKGRAPASGAGRTQVRILSRTLRSRARNWPRWPVALGRIAGAGSTLAGQRVVFSAVVTRLDHDGCLKGREDSAALFGERREQLAAGYRSEYQQRLGLVGIDQGLAMELKYTELRVLDAHRRAVRASTGCSRQIAANVGLATSSASTIAAAREPLPSCVYAL